MPEIRLLDKNTIDKIAAGEVIERPSSVVKELVENAIDAGSTAVTVEIKGGGISLIRVTDNGCAIASDQIHTAFLSHSTSKIRSEEDLRSVSSLGFRGEALSSIAAVSRVELITRQSSSFTGSRYVCEGGKEISLSEVASPCGTTFLVRDLFYNTPARRKFLKTDQTEAGYISGLMERMALSRPDISFKFINNGQIRMHTSGNGRIRDMIYHIYGRDIAVNLLEINSHFDSYSVTGFIGKPSISRGNRNYENYFINGRYVNSRLIARSIEDAYRGFLMQHRFPFTVLYITIDPERIDVNVHPNKMQLRISDPEPLYMDIMTSLREALRKKDLIEDAGREAGRDKKEETPVKKAAVPEQFETQRLEKIRAAVSKDSPYEKKYNYKISSVSPAGAANSDIPEGAKEPAPPKESKQEGAGLSKKDVPESLKICEPVQRYMFDGPADDKDTVGGMFSTSYSIIGQIFNTYWLIEDESRLFVIDQHAAHEKILYERIMSSLKDHDYTSQYISPPVVLSLTMREEELLNRYMDSFTGLGFEISSFGGNEYSISAVPGNLFGLDAKEVFINIIDGLEEISQKDTPEIVKEKIASMSCRAAVKGNDPLSGMEAKALIDELMGLENPYFCPHGRPVIISVSRYEIEKKFKRIV